MDDNTPMTFTSIALLFMLFIMLAIFTCRYIGPRAHNWWIRTNKEEKIGLSKNKFFHANGYMIHSGSEFLISNSGSFKRFETIDKDDYKEPELNNGSTTSPPWNLADHNIPPQPLRPAPAPRAPTSANSQNKSVTFSFSQLNEITPEQRSVTPLTEDQNLIPCIRATNLAYESIPHPLEAPPPPRIATTPVMSSTAIPRPIAKRQQTLQMREFSTNKHSNAASDETTFKTLTRRNSSTNPFLCDSTESLQESSKSYNATAANVILYNNDKQKTNNNTANPQPIIISNGNGNNANNPFYEGTNPSKMTEHNGDNKLNNNNCINLNSLSKSNGSNKRPMLQHQPHSFRNRSFSETDSIETDCGAIVNEITNASQIKFNNAKNPFTGLTKHIKGPHMLQKTISEDYLFRKFSKPPTNNVNGNGTWSFGRSLMRQDSILNMGRRNSSQISLDSVGESMDNINLERAISCDSVASDSSLYFGDMEQSTYTQITGNLNVALNTDK